MTRTNGLARTPSLRVHGLVKFDRGAANFLAFPISFESVEIKNAAVFPDVDYPSSDSIGAAFGLDP